MPRFLRLFVRPEAAWREIRAEHASWLRILASTVVPLAILPSVAWPLGRMSHYVATESFVAAFSATYLLSIATVLLLACAFYVLGPFFGAIRNWDRAVAVASYSSTPVLLSGALLIVPILVIASVGAFLLGLGLCATGIQVVLDCRSREVAGFLASASVFLGASSMVLGALCSAIGLL